MNEQFKKWWEDVYCKTKPIPFPDESVHFWLRAFVKEVERRVRADKSPAPYDYGYHFAQVVRDFGLEDKA